MIKVWGCLFGALLALSAGTVSARSPKAVHSSGHHPAAVPSNNATPAAGGNSAAVGAGSSASASAVAAQADRDFLLARDAFKAGDAVKLDRLAPSLDGHVLAPYVRYWQLKLRVDETDPVAIKSFLASDRDSLLADRLRIDWLKALGRRGVWDVFAQEYPLMQDEDTELVCYGLQQRFTAQPAEAMAEAKRL